MPTIVLDGHFFSTPWTGVAYYSHGLYSALAEDRRAHALAVLEGHRADSLADWAARTVTPPSVPTGAAVSPRLHRLVYRMPLLRGIARRTRSLLHRLPAARLRCDLFHSLNYVPVTSVSALLLPVVHDMSCVTNPEDHPAERVRFFEMELPKVHAAPAVHTVSEFSRDEIVRLLGIDASRVHVIPPGTDRQCLASPLAGADPHDTAPLGLESGRYVAAVSTLEPRKNLRTLVAAQLALPPEIARRQPIVFAGARGWGEMRWPTGFDAAVADRRIILAGYLDRTTLVDLKRHARALAYPSVYEGFGLPVLEALACGTDALVSEGTACVEAGQGAAITLPALDVDAWAEELRRLAGQPITLDDRARLRSVALTAPNWADAARDTFALYEKILGRPLDRV